MYKHEQHRFYEWASASILSFVAVALLFGWQGNVGFNLWDEGFLWYGVQRVVKGEIPIRDFMSYDPGRYYWSAALVSIMGDSGIMQTRAAVAIFQAFGLLAGLLLVVRSTEFEGKDRLLFWGITAITLAVWMFPRHKLFDISLSIFLIGILAYLVRRPTLYRYFAAGTAVGLVAVFGRNHGVYGIVGGLSVILWLSIKSEASTSFVRGVLCWMGGIAVGFLPVVLMMLLVPGFALAFWESIRLLFEQSATNLPLPVPWPWTANFVSAPFEDAMRDLLVGSFFLAVLAFGWLGAIWVVVARLRRKPVPPGLVAAVFLAIPYSHYAFSRADVGHLAQGIFPMLVGCFILFTMLGAKARWFLTTALCAASLWVMSVQHPGWQCTVGARCVDITVSGSKLVVDPATARDVALLRHLTDQYAPDGKSFVATPFWPGAYALLERKSPMWEIYALFPRNESFERDEIERIRSASPGFIFVLNLALDGQDALRFRNTHPLTYRYIIDNFEPIPVSTNPAYEIYKAKSPNS
ncbi:hypothetical protein [Rhizobium sp. YTU87027]|uniref:hypothetical protein n=1 Tax=Rhizobium sp. YTU87027 TaxID=3417741 RepID=UPI003D69A773